MMNNTIMGFKVEQTDKYASQNNKSENIKNIINSDINY